MSLFDRIVGRVEDRANAAVEMARRNVEAAFAALPDVGLKADGDALAVEGIGLSRRWLSDARLRFAFWTR